MEAPRPRNRHNIRRYLALGLLIGPLAGVGRYAAEHFFFPPAIKNDIEKLACARQLGGTAVTSTTISPECKPLENYITHTINNQIDYSASGSVTSQVPNITWHFESRQGFEASALQDAAQWDQSHDLINDRYVALAAGIDGVVVLAAFGAGIVGRRTHQEQEVDSSAPIAA